VVEQDHSSRSQPWSPMTAIYIGLHESAILIGLVYDLVFIDFRSATINFRKSLVKR